LALHNEAVRQTTLELEKSADNWRLADRNAHPRKADLMVFCRKEAQNAQRSRGPPSAAVHCQLIVDIFRVDEADGPLLWDLKLGTWYLALERSDGFCPLSSDAPPTLLLVVDQRCVRRFPELQTLLIL